MALSGGGSRRTKKARRGTATREWIRRELAPRKPRTAQEKQKFVAQMVRDVRLKLSRAKTVLARKAAGYPDRNLCHDANEAIGQADLAASLVAGDGSTPPMREKGRKLLRTLRTVKKQYMKACAYRGRNPFA